MTKISIITPGIRTQNWQRLIDSVQEASDIFIEFIFVGPSSFRNIERRNKSYNFIYDHGSPIRAQQIGLTHCTGDYVTWAADDGWFFPGTLTSTLKQLEATGLPVIGSRYIEGGNGHITTKDDYCLLHHHPCTARPAIPKSYKYLNIGLIKRNFLFKTGGWDTAFEVCPMAHADLAVRIQNMGIMYPLTTDVMFECEHMPGASGDHGPIMYAQIEHDEPLFAQYYNEQCTRTTIGINNWENAPVKWERRFGK